MQVLIKKAGQSINVEWSNFPTHVQEHLQEYGVRQKLNDSISGYSKNGSETTSAATADEMFAVVEGVLERLYAGDIRAGRVAAPKTAEGLAKQEAYKTVVNAWLSKADNKGRKITEFKNREELAARYFEKNRDKLVEEATARLERMTMAADELEELGL